MRKKYRLTQSKDFNRVKQYGQTVYHPSLVLVYTRSCLPNSRLAVVVSKAVGNAVIRNLIRRRIQAYLNKRWDTIESGWDFIFYSRREIKNASYSEICFALEHLLKLAGVGVK